MSELDRLLAKDNENVKNSRKGLATFDRDLPEVIDGAAEMFGAFERYLSGAAGADEGQDREVLSQSAKELNLTAGDLIDKLSEEALTITARSLACMAYMQMQARRARAALFLLLQRSFMCEYGTLPS